MLMPLPFSLMLLVFGLLLLWFSRRQSWMQTAGKVIVSLSTGILIIVSLPVSSQWLNISLEREYSPIHEVPRNLDYVIVLGGGHLSDPYLPPHQQLSAPSYYRIMEGLRLMRANPGATLLLSGYGGSDPVSNAKISSIVARQNGIPEGQIRLFETAQDTAEEAALMASIIKKHRSALVTSASHMPRALSYFHALDVAPMPSPTLFLGKEPQNKRFFYQRLPSARSLNELTVAWHEVVGSAWRKVRN